MNEAPSTLAIVGHEQSLCVRCGLCCDGTLFAHALVSPEDDLARLEAEGFILLQVTAGTRFALPCHHQDGRVCTVYQQWRPQVCHSFRCALLRRLAADEISLAEAAAQIERTVALAQRIRAQLPAGAETRRQWLKQSMRSYLAAQAADGVDVNRTFAALLLDFASLQRLLDRHFRIEPDSEPASPLPLPQNGQNTAKQGEYDG